MSNTTQHRVHLLTSALALVTLLASCGGPSTPAAPSALSAPLSAAPTAAPKVQVPELRLVTTPRRLLRDGSVFFFITSRDHSGKGLTRTEVFVDGQPFVDDPDQYNSYGKYFTAQSNGEHTVRVVVTDALGVQATTEQTSNVEIAKP